MRSSHPSISDTLLLSFSPDVYPLVSIANLQAKLEPNCTASDRAASLLGKPREFSLKVHWHRQVGIPTNDNLRDQQPEHTPTCWCQKSCEIVYTVKVIDQKGKTVAQREAVSEKVSEALRSIMLRFKLWSLTVVLHSQAHLESNIKLSLVCEEERSTLQVCRPQNCFYSVGFFACTLKFNENLFWSTTRKDESVNVLVQ